MARFNFTNITLNSKADITQIMDNFNLIEANGALLSDVNAVNKKVITNISDIATLKTNVSKNTSDIATKSPTNHASSATTYGLGTSANYGHCKIINNITTSSYADGQALSAYQGKVLYDLISGKQNSISYGTGSPSGGNNGDIYIQYF